MSNALQNITGNLYDYPQYYELAFGTDWKPEYDFLLDCFAKYADVTVRSLFEPACGTGRLLHRFGRVGYQVCGNDLNPKMVTYCNARLDRLGLNQSVSVGDMSAFQLNDPADAAFNMISSFQHLATQDASLAHFNCVSKSLQLGGIYVLGMLLSPTAADPTDEEHWSVRRGHLSIDASMRCLQRNLHQRYEIFSVECQVTSPQKTFCLQSEVRLRTYQVHQILELLDLVPDFELVGLYDFSYDIEKEISLDRRTEAGVFVLRKVND